MSENVAAVVDLGSSKIACAIVDCGSGREARLLGLGVVAAKGVHKGEVGNVEDVAQAIDSAVRLAQGDAGVPVEGIVVGIGGAHVEGRNSQGFVPIVPANRAITREDVLHVINHSRRLMTSEGQEQIQALPREFVVDGTSVSGDPVGKKAAKLEVRTHLISADARQVQSVERALAMGGYRLEELVALPLAAGLGVLTREQMDKGVIVVDIGSGKTEVAVLMQGSLAHCGCVPVGGGHVTSDIQALLKTSQDTAEKLKRAHGCALASECSGDELVEVMQVDQTVARPLKRGVLCQIVESRMRELATLVRKQLDQFGIMELPPAGLVITGGGSRLPATAELFAQVLDGVAVRLAGPRLGNGAADEIRRPEASAVIGLTRYVAGASDALEPASGAETWRERIRNLGSMFARKK
jgi:cell division protein FtsA